MRKTFITLNEQLIDKKDGESLSKSATRSGLAHFKKYFPDEPVIGHSITEINVKEGKVVIVVFWG